MQLPKQHPDAYRPHAWRRAPRRGSPDRRAGLLRRAPSFAIVLAMMAGLLGAVPKAAEAADRPLDVTPLISWNMQGSDNGAKWRDCVEGMALQAPILMLQEVGPTPPAGAQRGQSIQRTTTDSQGVQRTYEVLSAQWQIGSTSRGTTRYVYFLQTQDDPNFNPRVEGGRVNIALVLSEIPDEIQVVENPVAAGRTALGARYGSHWYFTVHGLSGGGGDSAVLLDAIDRAVTGWQPPGQTYTWTVGGDFNVDPGILQTRYSLPAGVIFHDTPQNIPTHQNGGRLDYFVTTQRPQIDLGHADRRDGLNSDHFPVGLGRMQAAAEPLPLSDVRWEATGDSITYADGFGSSTGGGYIEDLDIKLGTATIYSLLGMGASNDLLITKRAFVGDRSAGGFANEAWPGEEIAQIEHDSEASFARYRPNVVSVLAGTNDMVHNTDVAHAPDRLDAYLGQILTDDPGVTILVATVPPSTNTQYQARIDAYNDGVRRVAKKRRDDGQHVFLVELSSLTTADLHDVVHPNDAGYQKIADSFYMALLTTIYLGWVAEPGTPTSPNTPAECNERGGWQPKGIVAKGVNGKPSDDLPHRVRFADLDGDGKADYLILGDGASIVAYLNRGTDAPGGAGWQYRGEYAAGGNFTIDQVRLADVNGDGKADYLVVHDGGEVDAWINHGGDSVDHNGWHPTWEAWPQFARGGTGATVDQIQFADIDGDGKADYLKVDPTTGALTEWRNAGGDRPGVNGWEPRGQIARGGTSHDWPYLHLADVNCDHRTDYLVTNNNGGVTTFLDHGGDHDGVDGWQPIGVTAPGIGNPLVQFADLDGDGRADYLVVDYNGSVTEYRNNGGDPA
ncbi:FG-GAP-like repeat-containing protein [Streptomyces sp. NPDC001544]|uniref:FG-GAP-like repeat-containing protein n=1 Tax=Streptomyces sp. NPDC001544 TaxID=3364584 RepID=UPI0036806AE5